MERKWKIIIKSNYINEAFYVNTNSGEIERHLQTRWYKGKFTLTCYKVILTQFSRNGYPGKLGSFSIDWILYVALFILLIASPN